MDTAIKTGKLLENSPLLSKNIGTVILVVAVSSITLLTGIFIGAKVNDALKANSPNSGVFSQKNSSEKETKAPKISNIKMSELTNSTVVIRWHTNKDAVGQVDYGVSNYEFTSEIETTPDKKHEIFLANLIPGTTYHFQIRSTDPFGNLTIGDTANFVTLSAERGWTSICGWDGDSVERVDTFCATLNGWAKGESWTDFCATTWGQTDSVLVDAIDLDKCVYQFSSVEGPSSVASGESWQVTLQPTYTGFVDILLVSNPDGAELFSPAAKKAEAARVTMNGLSNPGKYSFRFRPADDSASWSDLLTITVRK